MKTRLQKFIDSQGITAAKFADEIGVQRSAVSHILSDRNKPGFDFIQKILSRYPQINAEWLMMGTGHMFKEFKQGNLFDSELNISGSMHHPVQETKPEKEIETQNVEQRSDLELPEIDSISEKIMGKQKNKVDKIVFFYNDKTFSVYYPEEI